MAVAIRGGRDAIAGVIMHTDRGSEYTAKVFRAACARMGIKQSMGRVGSALDRPCRRSSRPKPVLSRQSKPCL